MTGRRVNTAGAGIVAWNTLCYPIVKVASEAWALGSRGRSKVGSITCGTSCRIDAAATLIGTWKALLVHPIVEVVLGAIAQHCGPYSQISIRIGRIVAAGTLRPVETGQARVLALCTGLVDSVVIVSVDALAGGRSVLSSIGC